MENKGRTETEVTKESERKPSLQHSISKDDEKMKVKDSISDRTTLAVAEFKQDVIKVNDIVVNESILYYSVRQIFFECMLFLFVPNLTNKKKSLIYQCFSFL